MADNQNKDELLSEERLNQRKGFLINLAYVLVWVGIALLALRCLTMWLMPFVFAFLVAALLQKPLKWLVRISKGSRKFFSVCLVVLMIALLAGVVALVGWRLVVGITGFVGNSDNIEMIQNAITGVGESLQNFITRLSDTLSKEAVQSLNNGIASLSQQLVSLVTGALSGLATSAINLTTKLPMVLLSFIIWMVASVFLTIDYHQVIGFFVRQIPDRHADLFLKTKELCSNTLFKLLKAYALLMFITFVELSIGLLILQVPHAVVLAALIAVVDILPVLGTGTIMIPWALIELISGNYRMFIGLAVIYIIITVVRNILEPRLVSYQIGLNPLVTLLFMYLGLQVAGILGMMLFPVVVMILVQLQESGHVRIWK